MVASNVTLLKLTSRLKTSLWAVKMPCTTQSATAIGASKVVSLQLMDSMSPPRLRVHGGHPIIDLATRTWAYQGGTEGSRLF